MDDLTRLFVYSLTAFADGLHCAKGLNFMEELPLKIFMYLGILLLIISIVSIFVFSHGMTVTRKALYVSSLFMLLGFTAWGGVIFIIEPTMTLYFLLAAVCITGINLIGGMVSLAMRDRLAQWLLQRRK